MIKAIIGVILLIITQKAIGEIDVNFGFIGNPESEEFNGVKLGLDEAEHQGKFIGVNYKLFVYQTDEDYSQIDLLDVIVTNLTGTKLLSIIEQFGHLPVVNLSDASNLLRRKCISNAFHIIPSSTMLSNANRLATEHGQIRAWQYSFKKYAARQLNNRYFAKFNRRMSEEAWYGWAGIKIISEVTMRTRKPNNLMQDLKGDIKFDGQKGRRLSFRHNGQLRQPMFLVKNDKVIEEIPVHSNNKYGGLDLIGEERCDQ